jgi:hypothetical protein
LNNPTPRSKRTKMSKLAKHSDPKRYTLNLPPPLVRGAEPEDVMMQGALVTSDEEKVVFYPPVENQERSSTSSERELPPITTTVRRSADKVRKSEDVKRGVTMQVDWDEIDDEIARAKVMGVLRSLKA